MKKMLGLLIALLVIIQPFFLACAEMQDTLSNYSDEQIQFMIEELNKELERRHNEDAVEDGVLNMKAGTVILDDQGVVITLTDDVDMATEDGFFHMNAVLYNGSEYPIHGYIRDAEINGWSVTAFGGFNAKPGNKDAFHFTVAAKDAQVFRIKDIEYFTFSIHAYTDNSSDQFINKESITMAP